MPWANHTGLLRGRKWTKYREFTVPKPCLRREARSIGMARIIDPRRAKIIMMKHVVNVTRHLWYVFAFVHTKGSFFMKSHSDIVLPHLLGLAALCHCRLDAVHWCRACTSQMRCSSCWFGLMASTSDLETRPKELGVESRCSRNNAIASPRTDSALSPRASAVYNTLIHLTKLQTHNYIFVSIGKDTLCVILTNPNGWYVLDYA